MGLSEVYKFLVDLPREGIVAFVIGLALGGWAVGWAVYRHLRGRSRAVIDRLRAEGQALQDDLDRQRDRADQRTDEVHRLRERYARAGEYVQRQWRGHQSRFRYLLSTAEARGQEAEAGAEARRAEAERLRSIRDDLAGRLDEQAQRCHALEAQVASTDEELAQLRSLSDHIEGVVRELGNFWLREVPADAPAFVPPRQRRPPVIALLNFKGGVGKTTLTANLAATFAGRGERVLMIDLDYQGSLTSLVLSDPADLRVAAAERRLVHDFFLAGARRGELRPYVHWLTDLTDTLAILPATDPLADVEAWLMARWLIRPQEGDVRFALRAALHNPDEAGEFDRVLIDCPPRLTTACVNALACCDYILIPAILDRTSTLAAPRLLGLLRQLQPVLMPALGGVGLVANRVSRRLLAAGERDSWNDLADQCRDAWGWPVDGLPTVVPQNVAFRNAANRGRLAANESKELGEVFARLADELNERVPCESRRASSVPR